jgi:hypothetical protein
MTREPARHTDGDAINDLLLADPVCEEIAAYLSWHTHAVDAARGIAEWWIDRDPGTTERALEKLADHGVLRVCVNRSARIYGLSRNPLVRRVVAAHAKAAAPPRRIAEG